MVPITRDHAFPLAHSIISIGFQVAQSFEFAGRPSDFDCIHLACGSQAKVNPQVVLREIAAAAVNFIDLRR